MSCKCDAVRCCACYLDVAGALCNVLLVLPVHLVHVLPSFFDHEFGKLRLRCVDVVFVVFFTLRDVRDHVYPHGYLGKDSSWWV